jgi:cyclase
MLEVVRKVAAEIFIPFSVGGGLNTLEDMSQVILAGAEKVSVNSGAVADPDIIRQGAEAFGSQCIVLGTDILRVGETPATPSGYEVVTHGGRRHTGMDAVEWVQRAEALGAGEICLNSIDADGTREGYELPLTRLIATSVGIPVIASGGAGTAEHLADVLTEGCADAALIASMVHFGGYRMAQLKQALHERGIKVRMTW